MEHNAQAAGDCSLEFVQSTLQIDPIATTDGLVSFIAEQCDQLQRDGVILGLSGGLDSAVVAALCARAVGPERTLALIMPDKGSARNQVLAAQSLAEELGIPTRLVNITPHLRRLGIYRIFPIDAVPTRCRARLVQSATSYLSNRTDAGYFRRTLGGAERGTVGALINRSFVYYRGKHRMRMVILYLHAELENRLVVGAANKSEYRIGFFVKHGVDAATDIMPIMGLYKTQVVQLARHLGIPPAIVEKAPSPDLVPGIDDESAIGLTYSQLDLVLSAMELGWSDEGIARALGVAGVTTDNVRYVRDLVRSSEHMRTVFVPG